MTKLPLAFLATLSLASVAQAQDEPRDDLRIRVGLGAEVRPSYIGGDDREVGPLFDIDIARGDNLFGFEAPDDKFAIPIISKDGFSVGPTANIEGKRKPSDVGAAVDKVSTTFEAGVYAQFLPLETIRIRGDVRKGIGGHEGVVGGISVDKFWRDGDRYVFSVGPRLSFSDARYQRAYFGVDSEASLASGLPAYRPGGGVHAVGAASGLSYQFNPRFGMFGYARYERLIGDAAKSPIVREFGSRNQLSTGLGLSYTFTVRR